jgi:hypothetical protein
MIENVPASPLIEIISVSEVEDGRLQAVVLIGRSTSAQLGRLGERQTQILKRHFARGLREFTSQQGYRIVARIPARAVALLDEVCEKMHSSRSSVLLARVERYVDGSGEIIRRRYHATVRSSIVSEDDWNQLGQIQVVAPKIQAKGFDRFCRKAGIKKSAFFLREIEGILRRAEERDAKDRAEPGMMAHQ